MNHRIYPIKVSLSEDVHIRWVCSFCKTLAIVASVFGICSSQDQVSLAFLLAAPLPVALVVPALPPLPRFDFVGGGTWSSSETLTFSAALTNQWRRKAYISRVCLCSMYSDWSPVSISRRVASSSVVSPESNESRSLDMSMGGTRLGCLKKLR